MDDKVILYLGGGTMSGVFGGGIVTGLEEGNIYNKIDANSFPSIHSARISLIAVMFSLFYKDAPTIIACVLVVLCVGYSRIYLKRHHPIDVLAGFLIGAATALIVFYIIK